MRNALVVFGAMLGLVVSAYAQPGGGRMGQGGMARGGAFSLESDWALICFEMKVEGEAMGKLYGAFQKAWDQRRKAMEQVRSGQGDRNQVMEGMAEVQRELDGAIVEIMGREGMERLEALRSERQSSRQGGGRGQ